MLDSNNSFFRYAFIHQMWSYIYRGVCLSYGLYIALYYPAIFTPLIYIVACIAYAVLFILSKKFYDKSNVRLFVDMAFISFVLYGKPFDCVTYVFALLPMINSINYTGGNSSFLPLAIVTFVGILLIDETLVYRHFVPPFFLIVCNIYAKYIRHASRLINNITRHIDDYFINPKSPKPHSLYSPIIRELNAFFGKGYVKGITSYIVRNDELWLVNASEFSWRRKADISLMCARNLMMIRQRFLSRYLRRFYPGTSTFYYNVDLKDVEYIFQVHVKDGNLYIKQMFYQDYLMQVIFGKLARLLKYGYNAQMMRDKAFADIQKNYEYVNTATDLMHYIRNKLMPIHNVLTFYTDHPMTLEQQRKMSSAVKKVTRQAQEDMEDLLKMATYILKKENNPYLSKEKKPVSVRKLFVILSEVAEQHLNTIVHVDESQMNEGGLADKVIMSNIKELKILFTDWCANIDKYHFSFYYITMYVNAHLLIVQFYNDHQCDEKQLENLLYRLNTDQQNDLLQWRKTAGVTNMKTVCSNQNISMKASEDCLKIGDDTKEKLICLTLKFDIYGKEDIAYRG